MHFLASGRSPVWLDGRFVRDYLFVDDGAAAYIDTVQALAARRDLAGQAFKANLTL
jgi:CDP-glucose 4,6-dehydratase